MLDIKNEHFTLSVDLSGSSLTPREKDIVALLLAGYRVTTISRMKHRSVKTVSAQKASAYKKLGVRGDIGLFPGLIKRWGMRVSCGADTVWTTTDNITTSVKQAG
ncbi:DNA-binding response regulator [Salmonella enterica subsp. salamae]|nr:DNA-binding response regulator [Salmonella enterica subsp. salamae]EDW5993854.1 response regulator transcription factor [Salmonella enterica subsp. salamae]